MPIQILKYITAAHDVWTQERHGRRFVARCVSKAAASRIVRLLNADLARRPVPTDSLPAELRDAITKAFEATGAADLYEGDAVKMLAVVTQCLDARRHQVTGAAEAARKLNLALGNAVSEESD